MTDPKKNSPEKNGRRIGDWASWITVAALGLLLPVSVLCCAALLLPLRLFWDDAFWLIYVYFGLGITVLIPGIDRFFWRLTARDARDPNAAEQTRLDAAWAEVMRRSKRTDGSKYRLLVIETDEVNAMAGGARLVFVTTAALDVLDDETLSGVLAHELGHHVGLHPIVLALEVWFMRPITWTLYASAGLSNIGVALAESFQGGILRLLASIVALAFRAFAWVLFALSWVAITVFRFTGRGAEYRADRFAAVNGFGAVISEFLEVVSEIEEKSGLGRNRQMVEIIASTHPPAAKRLRRLRRHMR